MEFVAGAGEQPDPVQEPVDVAGGASLRYALKVDQIPASRHVRVEGRHLDDSADTTQRLLLLSGRAEQAEAAGRWADQPQQHPHSGRLPRTVRAKKPVDMASAHLQREPVHGYDLAVSLRQPICLDNEIVHVSILSHTAPRS